jgi:hypothetical protein
LKCAVDIRLDITSDVVNVLDGAVKAGDVTILDTLHPPQLLGAGGEPLPHHAGGLVVLCPPGTQFDHNNSQSGTDPDTEELHPHGRAADLGDRCDQHGPGHRQRKQPPGSLTPAARQP